MDITKRDSKMLKGVAILSMLMLHLFCRRENLPYTPLLWVNDTPLIYYFALFGDICVAIYCFISGYAHYLQSSKSALRQRWKRLLRFFIPFWVIIIVFSLVGLLAGNAEIPKDWKTFLLHCLTIKNSYNGAWWYANTYLVLIILQPLSRKFAERFPTWLALFLSFAFYVLGYGIRFWDWGAVSSAILSWIIFHLGLLGTSYFPYMLGMLFCKWQVIATLRQRLSSFRRGSLITLALIAFAAMLLLHSIVQPLFTAAFTALGAVVLLCICPPFEFLVRLLCYLGDHSANIWLTHMFFYSVLFNGLVFRAKYPLPIVLLLLALSLASSYVIRGLSKPILKLLR